MTMVRSGYPQVYRPKSVTFGDAAIQDEKLAQTVYIQGPQGKNWEALYTLQMQSDSTFKITGVFLKPDDSAV
jgi:hypothetical protein